MAIVCAVGLAAWIVPIASAHSAHHSIGAVSMACDGTTTYTATAWAAPTAAARTNSDVRVSVSYNGGGTFTQVGSGQFSSANGFSFSGSFSAGSAQSAVVKTQEVAKWGDGAAPGPATLSTATRPTNCTPVTTVAVPPVVPPVTPVVPPVTPPVTPVVPPVTPPVTPVVPPVTPTPPVTPVPPTPAAVTAPARSGFCDAAGRYYDLEVGQDKQAPYDQLHLRPADKNAGTNALSCVPSVATVASVPSGAKPAATTPVARAGYCDKSGNFYFIEVAQATLPPYRGLDLGPARVDARTGAMSCAQTAILKTVALARKGVLAATASRKVLQTKQLASARKATQLASDLKTTRVALKKARATPAKTPHTGVLAAATGKTLPFTK